MEPLQITGVTYLGGLTYLPESKWIRIGRLTLDDDALMLDRVQDKQMRNLPPLELCRTRAIASLEITSEQVAKSKIGAALVFGVLGGVTAKGTADRATVIIYLKSGEKGYLAVDRHSAASLLGVLAPWMRGQGIPERSPEVAQSVGGPTPALIADELMKLSQLKAAGDLSGEEFAALKGKLIADHLN